MKLLRYQAHNIMRLSDIDLNLEGHHLYMVGGNNRQGKSSLLNGILMALCGKSGMDSYPDVPLKEGEDKGWVKLSLSGDESLLEEAGLTVELFLKRKRNGTVVEEFRILDSTGDEAPEPRTLLKKLYQMRAFDPLAFERMDKKGKQKMLKDLVGLDFADYDEERKKLYDHRTGVNKDLTRVRSQFDAMAKHKDAPAKEASVPEIMAELEKTQAANKAHDLVRHEAAKSLQLQEANTASQARVTAQIDELKKSLAKLKTEATPLKAKVSETEQAASQLVDLDTDPIRQMLLDAEGINAKVRANKAYEEKKAELQGLQDAAEDMTKRMNDIESEKSEKLKSATWPVDGISIDDDGVLLNGLPIEQASTRERIITSTQIGMALNPKLRLLVSDGGGFLDNEGIAALEEILRENDFQMIVEMVTRSESDESLCAVIIEDGQVKNAK